METKRIENWEEKKHSLKKSFPVLTEEDLVYKIGEEGKLLRRLQEKLNKNEHDIRKWLSLMG